MKRTGIVFAAIFFYNAFISAQVNYNFTTYRNGNHVYCIAASSDNIFIGTDNGLLIRDYNGTMQKELNASDGLIDDYIASFFYTNSNDVWIGFSGGLALYSDNKVVVYDETSGLISNAVSDITCDYQNNIWISAYKGIAKYRNGTWENYNYTDTITRFMSIAADSNYAWAGTDKGLIRFDGITWDRYTTEDGLPGDTIISVFLDTNGELWIATPANGLAKKGETWSVYYDSVLNNKTINHILLDRDNNKWLCTTGGLIKLDPENNWNYMDELGNTNFINASIDSANNLWLVTSDILIRYNTTSTDTFYVEGILDNLLFSIAEDTSKSKWITTMDGISIYKNGWENIKNHIINNDFQYITSIAVDSKNQVWVSYVNSNGLSFFDGNSWHTYNKENSGFDAYHYIVELAVDPHDNIWITTDGQGIYEFDGQNWIHLSPLSSYARSIVFDKDSTLWLSTFDGIANYDWNKWTYYTTADGLPSNETSCMLVDNNNNLWAATHMDGVVKFNGETWTPYTTNEGLGENTVRCMAIDKNNNLWFGLQSAGISVYTPETDTWQLINTGLACNQINDLLIDDENKVWAATCYGLSVGNPSTVEISVEGSQSMLKSSNKGIKAPVVVNHFNKIKKIQFSLSFDPTILELKGIDYNGLYDLSPDHFDTSRVKEGHISFSYSNENIAYQSLENNSAIFSLLFNIISNSVDSTEVFIDNAVIPVEIIDNENLTKDYHLHSAWFEILDPSSSVYENANTSGLLVYPNPFTSSLSVFTRDHADKLEIVNLQGRIIYAIAPVNNAINLDLKAFERGLYFIKLSSEKGTVVKKIVKL